MSALILVHGATGFTGRLVCRALRRKQIPFAVSGRSEAKLRALVVDLGGEVPVHVVDVGNADSVRAAIESKKLVCACAGPFLDVGEPILACSARAGVHYVDTTGEQAFVARAVHRYRATAESSGACVVPALGYEIALADWAAHLAAESLGGKADAIDVVYGLREPGGAYASRGTLRSALAQFASDGAQQFVGGRLCPEAPAERVESFSLPTLGDAPLTAVSFPSPEAIVVPSHTGASDVCTFMTTSAGRARVAHAARAWVPSIARLSSGLVGRFIARSPEGPDDLARSKTRFEILARARKGADGADVRVTGHDPYGLTAEIQALAAERALSGAIQARGVVAPSVGFDAEAAFAQLEREGASLHLAPPRKATLER